MLFLLLHLEPEGSGMGITCSLVLFDSEMKRRAAQSSDRNDGVGLPFVWTNRVAVSKGG